MRVVAAELSEADAGAIEQCRARAAEAVDYCRAMKADAGARWNPANLEAAMHFQRMLEQPDWDVDDVHRLSNEFATGDFHDNVVHWSLRRAVDYFVELIHRAAWKGNTDAPPTDH
jgi:hypothetical protein